MNFFLLPGGTRKIPRNVVMSIANKTTSVTYTYLRIGEEKKRPNRFARILTAVCRCSSSSSSIRANKVCTPAAKLHGSANWNLRLWTSGVLLRTGAFRAAAALRLIADYTAVGGATDRTAASKIFPFIRSPRRRHKYYSEREKFPSSARVNQREISRSESLIRESCITMSIDAFFLLLILSRARVGLYNPVNRLHRSSPYPQSSFYTCAFFFPSANSL